MRLGGVVCLCLVFVALMSSPTQADVVGPADQKGSMRPFRVDDIFNSEELGTPTFSPDGRAIAFTRRRAATAQPTNALLIAQTRDDVWVQLAPGEPAKNLTNGAADHSGWWQPQWSPDGRHLAFLSSRGGNVHVWVWERATNKARVVSTEGIEFDGKWFHNELGLRGSGGCRWASNRELLCLAMLDGRAAPLTFTGRAVERATGEWTRARNGEVTANVINSLEFPAPLRRLLVIDLQSGRVRPFATIAHSGDTSAIWLAPAGRAVAFVEHESTRYPFRYHNRIGDPAQVGLRWLDGRAIPLNRALPENILTSTLAWSPNGKELAFFAFDKLPVNPELLYGEEAAKAIRHERVDSLETPARLWRVWIDEGRVEQVETGDIDLGRDLVPPSFMWTASGELVFRARRLSQRAMPHIPAAPSWLVLGQQGRTRALLAQPGPSPTTFESIEDGAAFLGLMDGDVWRIDEQRGTMRNLTEALAGPVQEIRVADHEGTGTTVTLRVGVPSDDLGRAILRSRLNFSAKGVNDYLLNPSTGQFTALEAPDPGAVVASVHPGTGTITYKADHQRGTFLWRGDVSGHYERVAATNDFRAAIIRPEQRIIEYRTLNGEAAKARLILPVGYQAGRRYPLVVDSDIGTPLGNSLNALRNPPEEIFPAAGYAYVFASSPVGSMDAAGRNNLLLVTNGLLPAVDAIVASGVADPDRVLVYGLSSFGFGVLGVVTQTTRFRAAVAGYAWSDQITQSLSISFVGRYSDNPFEGLSMSARYSDSSLPFWRNSEHHRRNSPFSYVDRVQTPLLMIQSDLDGIPIENAEMFFAALVLQRKVAQFVRYGGEGHVNRIPDNRRDEFQRVLAWFDEHGDISRDDSGVMLFDGDRVASRHGRPALVPEDFSRFGPTAALARPKASTSQPQP